METFYRQQATINHSVSVSGFGFWSGRDVTITFHPAERNTGIVFIRGDLPGKPRIPALVRHRIHGPRRTTLVHNGCAVEMVEHVMAALAGMGIDNCEIVVDRAEMPGCDGSSVIFTEALTKAGRITQAARRNVIRVVSPLRVGDENSWIEAKPIIGRTYRLTYQLDYPNCPAIGAQQWRGRFEPDTFLNDIASARTFVLQQEADELRSQGLGLRVSNRDLLVFNDHGPQDNQLRFDNECARHKALDVMGDFALLGTDIIGDFTAVRSGHKLNSRMVFALLAHAIAQLGSRPQHAPIKRRIPA